jgi:PadR family transcriptional regulator PadR
MLEYAFWSHEPLYQCLGYIESRYVRKGTYCIWVELKNCRAEIHEENSMKQKLREVQIKLMRGLLDLVILQFLKAEPMHGYQIITSIRKNFGVYFGPSTIYPLLSTLEEKGYTKSQWDVDNDRPRKVYSLTHDGHSLLNGTEESLNHICRRLTSIGLNRLYINGNNNGIPKSPQRLS